MLHKLWCKNVMKPAHVLQLHPVFVSFIIYLSVQQQDEEYI